MTKRGGSRKARCERELFYESLGLPPRNCITDDRMLCEVCLRKVQRRKHG